MHRKMNQYLIYVIPLFLFFVLFELIADALTHKKAYRFADTITNLSLGIGQQIIEALIKTVFSFLFLWVYGYALFQLPDTVWTFLAVLLISDFIYYWFHRLSHSVNILWAVHVVHHQSAEFNLTVSLRQPWLHKLAAFGFFLLLPLLGVSPAIMILAFAFQTFYQFWLHTRFIGKLGILEKVLVTPSHHRVHHGSNKRYLNKNYGNTLIIWDKLFGTFQEEDEPVVYGITEPFTSTNPFWANMHFWSQIARSIKKRKGFFNKSGALFLTPADISEKKTGSSDARHINLAIPPWLTAYILAQFLLVLAVAFYFLLHQDAFPFLLKLAAVLFLLWSICHFSMLMQQNKHWVPWELARLATLCLLVYLFLG